MELFRLTMLFLHFIGLAVLLGTGVAQLRQRRSGLLRTMFMAALVQLLTGVGLVFSAMRFGDGVDEHKIMFKMGIALVVLVLTGILAFGAKRAGIPATDGGIPPPGGGMPLVFTLAMVAAVANVGVAVFWT